MISVDNIIAERLPKLNTSSPLIKTPIVRFLKYLFHEREFTHFEKSYPHLTGIDFVEQVLEYFEFNSLVNDRELFNIPDEGKVVAIANHPIGSLDGLALLKLFSKIRPDVKVVANELLWTIKPLRSMLLPVNNMAGNTPKENMRAIEEHVENGGALLIFPAGEVSRLSPKGVMDGKWRSGFLRFAKKTKAPVLPLHIDGKNSIFFYALSLLAKPISTLWLIDEMFKQKQRDIRIRIGKAIEYENYANLEIDKDRLIALFKKQVYGLAKKRPVEAFKAGFEALAHPENKKTLKRDIKQCQFLGSTQDGKQIYLYQHNSESTLLREIGRLRELTFRRVGEGTGRRRDIDQYDEYYDHLILWDKDEFEIVGAYRMASINTVRKHYSDTGLYSETLFDFSNLPEHISKQGLELGRSFIQPNYWGKRSLDYLWQGVGAYLQNHDNIRYLIGAVTISNEMNLEAKTTLVRFYQGYFPCHDQWIKAKTPFEMQHDVGAHFRFDDYENEFKQLKAKLKQEGSAVPSLYKQYAELCEKDGVAFCAFNIDADFCYCVDGLVVVDMERFKPAKRERYLTPVLEN
ncbi:MAG: lysophospholipid acyltransferase family protein [Gammaproteobacteria bacterium]|nr:lysophospholipid acyltransferase family protein [Gammaproteobacteria bacterium]